MHGFIAIFCALCAILFSFGETEIFSIVFALAGIVFAILSNKNSTN